MSTETNRTGEARRWQPSTDGVDARTRDEAIAVLTALARSTHPGGSEIDFAGALADILTAVTADVGSIEHLLAGRPMSWEADCVRRLVNGTADEDILPQWRTDPLHITLPLPTHWYDLGLEDLALDDYTAVNDRLKDLAEDTAEFDAVAAELDALVDLEDADRAAYIAAFGDQVRAVAAELRVTAPVEVRLIEDPKDTTSVLDPIEWRIYDVATDRTAHPITDSPADDLRTRGVSGSALAEALRAAGYSYRDRIARTRP